MKNGQFILRASIVAALAAVPALALASSTTASGNSALAGINTAESARVTQVVNNNAVSMIQGTHLAFVSRLAPIKAVSDSARMDHMQLVLRPSAEREAAMKSLLADQHNPQSPRFHQWLTPEQFGQTFGVADSDIAAVKSWLVSQGFKVNGAYPNNTQIDFSGTAGQVRQAFHVQEQHYTINGEKHIANAGNISVPKALQPVIAGVLGLNDMRPQAQHLKPVVAKMDPVTHRFSKAAPSNGHSLAVNFTNGYRGLAPNDFSKMYGVMPLRHNGVTGAGITVAVVENQSMVPGDWTNFVSQFNLGSYGGTFNQIQPNVGEINNCIDPTIGTPGQDGIETVLDAEYVTGLAPGANLVVASCDNQNSTNQFGGVFIAATNLINSDTGRPDVISASYGLGEQFMDPAGKAAIDLMWAQADAEGISVFVSTGDSGSNPSFNGSLINGYYGNTAIDANAFASSPNVTAVGGTDTADIIDGTTSQYFNNVTNIAYGSAKGYVPEIPWNQSCGNGVVAKARGWSSVEAFCNAQLAAHPDGLMGVAPNQSLIFSSEAGSGGPSMYDRKPVWQRLVTGAARDQSRDLPDVSLFAGPYGGKANAAGAFDGTYAIICTNAYPCAPGFTTGTSLEGGTSLASPMMAGIQALIDQGIAARGLPAGQGNAAPTLYALAGQEFGTGNGPAPASLATCNSDNGMTGTANCVFHNVTRGANSTNCYQYDGYFTTPDCYIYAASDATVFGTGFQIGLTSLSSTTYNPTTKAYSSQPGWSFATGLGSVDATNLLIAWRAFVHAPAAPPAP
ncbi:MAG: S53 family peptidase [Rhodanobacter sp.]